MRTQLWFRRRALAVTVASLAAIPLVTPLGVARAATASLAVSPGTPLWDSEIVRVSSTTLPTGGHDWTLKQCAPSPGGCDASAGNWVTAHSDAAGVLALTDFRVHRAIDVSVGGGTVPVDCTVSTCTVEATGMGPSPGGPHADLSFAVSDPTFSLASAPNTDLFDGQVIRVSSTVLPGDYDFVLRQCAPGAGGCDQSYSVAVRTTAGNTLPATGFAVRRQITASGGGLPSPVPVDCRSTPCTVEATGAGPSPGGPHVAISFATTAAVTGTVSVVGTVPAGAQSGLAACPASVAFRADCPGLRVTYASGAGTYRLLLTPGSWNTGGFIALPAMPAQAITLTVPTAASLTAAQSLTRNVTVTSPLVGVSTYGDFNGDGRPDIAVYRPTTGQWLIRGLAAVTWGRPGDVPVPGNWLGDGRTDIAVYRPTTGQWLIRGLPAVAYGRTGDIPVAGNWLGDGHTDIAVYRPTTGQWLVRGLAATTYGRFGDVPVPGNWLGDARTDIAVYRMTTGQWLVKGLPAMTYGRLGDVPVPANWYGDRYAEMAVFRPSTGQWLVAGWAAVSYGRLGDLPVPGNWIGTGYADIAAYRPSSSSWLVRTLSTVVYGRAGDVPV